MMNLSLVLYTYRPCPNYEFGLILGGLSYQLLFVIYATFNSNNMKSRNAKKCDLIRFKTAIMNGLPWTDCTGGTNVMLAGIFSVDKLF